MKCPLSFNNPYTFEHGAMDCLDDCMFRTEVVKNGESCGFICAFASSFVEEARKGVTNAIAFRTKIDTSNAEK